MKKNVMKKAGAVALLGLNVAIMSPLAKQEESQKTEESSYTKISSDALTHPANAQLASELGGGVFWQGMMGGTFGVAGALIGAEFGPVGGYFGAVAGAAVGGW